MVLLNRLKNEPQRTQMAQIFLFFVGVNRRRQRTKVFEMAVSLRP